MDKSEIKDHYSTGGWNGVGRGGEVFGEEVGGLGWRRLSIRETDED